MDGGGAEDCSGVSWVELWLKEGLAADTQTTWQRSHGSCADGLELSLFLDFFLLPSSLPLHSSFYAKKRSSTAARGINRPKTRNR